MPRSWLALLLVLLLPMVLGAGDVRDLGPAVYQQMQTEARVALVIGNGAYPTGRLANPPNDAMAIASALRAQGFQVSLVTDASKLRMEEAIIDFGRSLKNGGVGLFFYAGHGLQHQGRNYLVPLDAKLSDEAYIKVRTVDMDMVTAEMEAAHNRLNIVILDACRNNPYASRVRSQSRGLAMLAGPTGTYIAYSASANQVAEDGAGGNSTFTAALVQHMAKPGADLDEVFNGVRTEVWQATSHAQTPESRSMVVGPNFYFDLPDTVSSVEEEQLAPAQLEVRSIAPKPGIIQVSVEQFGPVSLDGEIVGKVEQPFGMLELRGVSPGEHEVSIGTEIHTVGVTPGGTVQVQLTGGWAPVMANVPFLFGEPKPVSAVEVHWASIPGGILSTSRGDGESNEEPVSTVQVSGFELSRSEVTVAQYRACVEDGVCTAPETGKFCVWGKSEIEEHPVNCVTWSQANTFVGWAGGRLPTEHEWAYAAKGGQSYVFAGSDLIDEVAWYVGNSDRSTHSVCGKQPNGYGLCDMSGNVREWTGMAEGHGRVYCGGSWDDGAGNGEDARCGKCGPTRFGPHIGFRVAR